MKVQHKKTGRTAEVLSQDEKLVKVRFVKEGTEQNMTVSTFKRWWKAIEDDDVCGDGTPLAEVGKEIAEQAKQKAEKAKVQQESKKAKPKKEKVLVDTSKVDEVREFILKYVTSTQKGSVFSPANGMKMRAFKVGGKMYAKMDFSSKSVRLQVRSKAILPEVKNTPDTTYNHLFDYGYKFVELDKNAETLITQLLDLSIKYQKATNSKSKSKKGDK